MVQLLLPITIYKQHSVSTQNAFLCAAPTSADHALNLTGLARTYKEEQGVEAVIAVMTGDSSRT